MCWRLTGKWSETSIEDTLNQCLVACLRVIKSTLEVLFIFSCCICWPRLPAMCFVEFVCVFDIKLTVKKFVWWWPTLEISDLRYSIARSVFAYLKMSVSDSITPESWFSSEDCYRQFTVPVFRADEFLYSWYWFPLFSLIFRWWVLVLSRLGF